MQLGLFNASGTGRPPSPAGATSIRRLPGAPIKRRTKGESIDDRFRAFCDANPDVYAGLRDLALAGVRRGLKRLGIGALYEVLRWQRNMQTVGDEFVLNNDFRSRYARLLLEREPSLATAGRNAKGEPCPIFETRRLGDEEPE